MMKSVMIGLGSLVLLATAAPAQEISVGPGGVSIGRDHDAYWRHQRWERRHRWDDDTTGTVVERRYGSRCHITTIRRENEDGDMVTRRIRRCD